MRLGVGFAVLLTLVRHVAPAAPPPTDREVLDAFEKQLKAVAETGGPAVACVVMARGDQYPKPADPPAPGRLGEFDRKAFLDTDPTPARAALARRLDLSDPASIPDHSYAGGVVIDPAGLVLTTWHAIDGATKVYVHLGGGKGSYADIHAADARTDLAVLKLLHPPPGLKAVKLGGDPDRPRPSPGTLAVLLTRPYTSGFELNLAPPAVGPLGAVLRRRPAQADDANKSPTGPDSSVYQLGDLLEHRLPGGVGFSGGAVLSRDGELIGLTTATAMPTGDGGPGYALPIDPGARRVIDVLARGREVEPGFLGVVLPRPPVTGGLPIERLVPQGPAGMAGLKVGDVIIRVNETPVSNQADLHLALRYALAGTPARVVVRRGGQTREFEVVPGKAAHQRPFIASVQPDPVFGLRVDFNTPLIQQAEAQRGTGVPPGVVIRELVPDSPAAAKFKALGEPRGQWLITHVDGTPVSTPAEFYKAAKGKPAVKLTVLDPLAPAAAPRAVILP
jgi:serine protease Do